MPQTMSNLQTQFKLNVCSCAKSISRNAFNECGTCSTYVGRMMKSNAYVIRMMTDLLIQNNFTLVCPHTHNCESSIKSITMTVIT